MTSLIGRTLGKYEIIELLGQGGMATVYKGYQRDIDRYVAIKVLPPHPGQDPQFIERFRIEARTIARLQHPHILPLYDYGTEDDILYLVMAYVEGGALSDLIDSVPLPIKRVEKLLREIASAMDYAHRQGVVHRDIKPGNILLDTEGHALLADFGIVKLSGGDSHLTGTGGIVGTPAYIAPEQGSATDIDGRADIYSLGVVVYEMLTGQQPYTATTPMQVILRHMNDPIPKLADVLEEPPHLALENVMQQVLAKSPADRYQTATEFCEDFSHAIHREESYVGLQMLNGSPEETTVSNNAVTLPPQQPTVIINPSPTSNPLVLIGGFAILALLIVVVAVVIVSGQNRNPQVVLVSDIPASAVPSVEPTSQVAVVPTQPPIPTFGSLTFSTSKQPGDTVLLQVKELKPLPVGQKYAAWLVNTDTNNRMAVGGLTIDAFGTGSLTFVDPVTRNLPAAFNAVLITQEADSSKLTKPEGEIRYSGSVPAALTIALKETLVQTSVQLPTGDSVATPDKSGYGALITAGTNTLLNGALTEAQTALQHTGLAAKATNIGGLHTHAEHTINIVLGTLEDYDGNGRGENPGQRIGIPFFLDQIDSYVTTATNAPTASRIMQSNTELIRVCTQNVRMWIDQIVVLEKQLLASSDLAATTDQKTASTALAQAIIDGVDLNNSGQVEPFEGECGLTQIWTYGVLAATMPINEGPLKES